MASLDELQPLAMQLLLVTGFIGDGTLGRGAALARREIIRLVDKTVNEYGYARAAIFAQIAEANRSVEEMQKGRKVYMFNFTDHMENCINAIRRLLRLMEILRKDQSAPQQDRTSRRLVEANQNALIDVRNVFEHLNDAIVGNEIEDGCPVMLCLGDDQTSVRIGKHNLTFASLVSVIKSLHSEATALLIKPHLPPINPAIKYMLLTRQSNIC